jgi:hypothetical protein
VTKTSSNFDEIHFSCVVFDVDHCCEVIIFIFFYFIKKMRFTFLIEKIIVIELDKMHSCVEIKS